MPMKLGGKINKWTESQVKSFIEDSKTMSDIELCEKYKRSYQAIKQKRVKLGLYIRGQNWTKKEDESLYGDYLNHLSWPEMEKKYGRTECAIRSHVDVLGYKRIKPPKKAKLTKFQMVELYESGMTATEIGKLANINRSCTEAHLHSMGVEMRMGQARIYTVNHNYFDEVNNPETAYYVGLMYADGYNDEKNGFISIGLQEEDLPVLERFRDALGSNRPFMYVKPRTEKHKAMYVLQVNSTHMSKMLAKHGCIQRKSLKLQFPEWLPKELYRFLVKGYLDGDGSISRHGRGNHRFNLTGNKDFLIRVQEIMADELGLFKTAIYHPKKSKAVAFAWSGRLQVVKIMEWIYKDSTLHMERKYNKYQEIKELQIFERKKAPLIGNGVLGGKRVINTATGEIYDSAMKLSIAKKLTYGNLIRKLRGERANNTPYKFIEEARGKRIIDTKTHVIYNNLMEASNYLKMNESTLRKQLRRVYTNTTPFLYLTDFIQQNPTHPISLTHTQPQKQTA